MDGFQMVATSIGVIGVVLLMVLFVCRFIGPKTTAWICSNREEKIGFSKSKLYHANGYLIPSGSEFLLNPTGSFKRFESIDRDYKPIGQTSLTSSPPPWNIVTQDIPPQPLRPAPLSPTLKEKKDAMENSTSKQQQLQQQHSLTTSSPTQGISSICSGSTIIPRPIAKRQHSSPAGYGIAHINLSDAVARIANGPRSCTNPFLNGSLSISEDTNSNATTIHELKNELNDNSTLFTVVHERVLAAASIQPNPFSRKIDENSIFSFPVSATNGNVDTFNVNDDIIMADDDAVVGGTGANDTSDFALIQLDGIVDDKYSYTSMTEKAIASDYSDGSSYAQQKFRNRSLSDTLAFDIDACIADIKDQMTSDEQLETNPFVGGTIHKTVSDTQLEKLASTRTRSASQTWSFGRSLSRQAGTNVMNGSINYKTTTGGSDATDAPDLKRAMSCESVNSESSVILADLEQQIVPSVTGLLCVGLQYDKSTMTDEGIELILTVMEAKELIGPANADKFDTFVRIYMVPDETGALQTKLFKNSTCPSYNETFSFWLNKKRIKRSLWFHLYHSGNVHTLIGEAEFHVGDVRRPITTWLSLSDSRHNKSVWGELMFSLSYLPTAERLTVVVVKARNLKMSETQQVSLHNVFVKVYLLKDDKKVSKKKTSARRSDCSPIFNESMIFSVPPYMLNSIQIRLTVVNAASETNSIENKTLGGCVSNTVIPIGHVIVGSGTSGKGLRHWNQMLSSLRRPVAMWHAIRQTNSSKTGTVNA